MEEQEKLRKLLEAEKQEFLAVMSHELRTPMTGVKGYLSMVLDGDAGPISPDIKEYIASAYVANDRLIRLVDRVMKVVAVQEHRIKFNLSKVNLGKNVQLLMNDFQVPAKEKNLTITYDKPAEPIWVLADPDRMREVLMYIISNAIKFTKTGGVKISHRTINNHPASPSQGGLAVVDIIDTGIGIKKQDQDKIFEIFSKTNLTLAGQEKGTGVGLYLARHMAEAQNGKVWLEHSEAEKGSTFSVAFPIYK